MQFRWLIWLLLAVLATACGSSSDDDERPPAGGPLDYLALGASDAFGIGAVPLENGYVYRIDQTLEGEREGVVELVNLGIPGALADQIAEALDLALATGVSADIVTLWTGANDLTRGRTPAEFEADLAAILAALRQQTSALIFIGDLPDLTQLPRFVAEPDPDVTAARVAAFNEVIERQTALHGATIVRLSILPVAELTSDLDGFHPSNEGHAAIAEIFLQAIRPALGMPPPG